MRYGIFLFFLVLVGCAPSSTIPAANGQSGYLLVPMSFTSEAPQSAFPYSFVFNYSGTESGSSQIYGHLGKSYGLIGPLPAGSYTMDSMKLFSGSMARAQAIEFDIEPITLNVPFEVMPNTMTVFCCKLVSVLEGAKISENFSQVITFADLDMSASEVESRYQQMIASDPNGSGWTVKASTK